MKSAILLFLFSWAHFFLFSQPYTQNKFGYSLSSDITYGNDTDYAGNSIALKLDLYKPIGDTNCLRPIMILIHGGAWIGGDKSDNNMVYMSQELAKKGWVVANINYRLGTHKAASYTMYGLCNTSLSQPCGYISDSAEIYRAIYRGMQDAKGVIRYMKGRNTTDSSDIENVFIAGESAGAFIALAAGFTDQINEKHSSCYAISNAPNPDADMNTYSCIPNPWSSSRPDLGSIEGKLYLSSNFNAKVKGVGSFYGAVCNLNVFAQVQDTPLLYAFHQGSDVVVHYSRGTILGRTSYECYGASNICQPYYFYPIAHGGESIRSFLTANSWNSNLFKADIVNNYSYQNNCFSNGHSIDNINTRLQNMLGVFVTKIVASGNDPNLNCNLIDVDKLVSNKDFTLYPNPAQDILHIEHSIGLSGRQFFIMDMKGITVLTGSLNDNISTLHISNLSNGLYSISIEGLCTRLIHIFR